MSNYNDDRRMTFYTASFDKNTMELKRITESSRSPYGNTRAFRNGPFFIGPGSPCYKWTRNIDVAVLIIVLGAACAWLTKIEQLSVGIVPGVVAVSMTLRRINLDLGLAITLFTVGIFFGLLTGCVRIPLNREEIIWAIYTLIFCVAGFNSTDEFYDYYIYSFILERALVTIIVASIIGFILNHPVLYLFGWVGGIWVILVGIFSLVTPPFDVLGGILTIGFGIFVGSGCTAVGFNLMIHRAHIVYYLKRAWFAMTAAVQSNSTWL